TKKIVPLLKKSSNMQIKCAQKEKKVIASLSKKKTKRKILHGKKQRILQKRRQESVRKKRDFWNPMIQIGMVSVQKDTKSLL
ncbi:hypothetical protein, partial [uncultured Fibrobacter sp.]|uniref:hypothetical protein n=1 Tax=uncultured Fibrobacter sp. TaxID=261512 RepID=UPI0025CFBC20